MALKSIILLSVCTSLILYYDVIASFHVCVLFEVPRSVDLETCRTLCVRLYFLTIGAFKDKRLRI